MSVLSMFYRRHLGTFVKFYYLKYETLLRKSLNLNFIVFLTNLTEYSDLGGRIKL